MTDRDHKCPRCGGFLPTVTVKKLVIGPGEILIDGVKVGTSDGIYREVEEVADCVRCTGGY